jgi:hypothetical protein
VIRKEDPSPLPIDPWPALAAEPDPAKRRVALQQAIFAAWSAPVHKRDENSLVPLAEHVAGQDPTSIFLARIVIPAAAGNPPLRTATAVTIDNGSRTFVYTIGGLARWLGV